MRHKMCNKKYNNRVQSARKWAIFNHFVQVLARFGSKSSNYDKFPEILRPFVKVRESTAPVNTSKSVILGDLSQFDDSLHAAVEKQPSNLYTTTSSNDYRVYMYYYYGLDYNSTRLPDITP